MNESDIIKLYNARDESAIAKTREKYEKYCYTIAFNVLGNGEDAMEVVNDAYLAVWNAIPPENPRSFSSFIGKITRNLALKRHRTLSAKKRSASLADISLSELDECLASLKTVESESEERDLTRLLNDFLSSLPKKDRKILPMSFSVI